MTAQSAWVGGLRARRSSAAVLLAVVSLLVALTALLPLLTAAIARTLVLEHVTALGSLGRTVEVRAVSSGASGPVPPSTLQPVLGEQWDGLASTASGQMRAPASPQADASQQVTLLWRVGMCEQVQWSSGQCPRNRFEVAVPAEAARSQQIRVGQRVLMMDRGPAARPGWSTRRAVTVTGIFTRPSGGDYWRGIDVADVRPKNVSGQQVQLQYWLTPQSTFHGHAPRTPVGPPPQESAASQGWNWVETSMTRQLLPDVFTYDRLPSAVEALQTSRDRAGATPGVSSDLSEQVSTVQERVETDVDQITVIAPLLLAQLILLQAVLVWIVLRTQITARRQEAALLRLRPGGRRAARRSLLAESAVPILAAFPLGLGLAYLVDALCRQTWLGGKPPSAWSWTAAGAAIAAVLLVVLLVAVQVERTVRMPLPILLRTVPPRTSRLRLSAGEAVLLTVALLLTVTVASGVLTGPPVLVTPLAIALAAGLLLGGLLVPVGNKLSGPLLRRGRIASLLGLTSLARRPSTRQLIVAVTAAGAMITFATSTVVLGQTNRAAAAEATAGAPVRMEAVDTTGTVPITTFVNTIHRIDPRHEHLTPVLRVQSAGEGPVTLAGHPAAMSRISSHQHTADPWALLPAHGRGAAPYPAVTARWSPPSTDPTFSAPSLTSQDTEYRTAATVPVVPGGQAKTFVTALEPLMDQADRVGEVTPEVWSTGLDPRGEQRVRAALRRAGYSDVQTSRMGDERARLDRSASAYGLTLGLLVAAGALLVACLVLSAVRAAQKGARHRDRVALRLARTPAAVLRGAGRVEMVVTALTMLLGGVIGLLGARLAAPHIPWYSTTPAYDVTTTTPPMAQPLLALLIGIVVVTAVHMSLSDRRRT